MDTDMHKDTAYGAIVGMDYLTSRRYKLVAPLPNENYDMII
jgi:hypothetical protein